MVVSRGSERAESENGGEERMMTSHASMRMRGETCIYGFKLLVGGGCGVAWALSDTGMRGVAFKRADTLEFDYDRMACSDI